MLELFNQIDIISGVFKFLCLIFPNTDGIRSTSEANFERCPHRSCPLARTFNHVKIGIHNRLLILNQIRLRPGITRAELARSHGLTSATVGNVVEKLLQMGYVLESEGAAAGQSPAAQKRDLGRPSLPLAVNAQRLYTVGLSCDLRHLQACLLNLNGEVVAFREQDESLGEPESYVQALAQLYQGLLSDVELPGPPSAVGLAAMGPLDLGRGAVYLHSGSPQWQNYDFVSALQRAVGVPVLLEKNSTAGALHEIWSGRARELDSLLYVYLGRGVGGALLWNNELVRGSFANAGEIGHVCVVPEGRPCLCGRRGCLEAYLSLDALEEALPFAIRPESQQLADLFFNKEPHFMSWLQRGAELLCRALGSIVNLLDLCAVVLTGLFPECVLSFLRDFLSRNISQHVMNGRVGRVEFLLGRAANQPSLGAALLPICESLSSGLIQSDVYEHVFAG